MRSSRISGRSPSGGQQESQAGAQTILQTDLQARQAQGLGNATTGEAGVAGVSVDAMLGGIDRERANANTITGRNTDATLARPSPALA